MISDELGKEMYDALIGMMAAADEYAKEFIKHEGACDWGIVNEAFLAKSAVCAKYQEFVASSNGKNTLVCINCDATLQGDPPAIHCVCNTCKEIIENAYPDGWTCSECETVFYDRMPAEVNVDWTGGTVCKRCYSEDTGTRNAR
jgi:hypothetical protein